jgi:hypothetical protein
MTSTEPIHVVTSERASARPAAAPATGAAA